MIRRYKNFGIYAVAIVIFGVALFLWVGQGSDTQDTTENTNQKVTAATVTIEDLKQAVEDLQKDHDGQDALAVCLGKLIIASQRRTVTDVEFETCVITTSVPARQTNEGTEPSSQAGSPSQPQGSQSSGSSSSSNRNTPSQPSQPDNSQPPEDYNVPILPEAVENILDRVPGVAL